MPLFDDPPLHDFPDRAIRRLLEDPANLADLIAALLPDLVGRFDFTRMETLGREFLLDDWRRRESDLLFRLPLRVPVDGETCALICLLIEHQSEPDPSMPLRVLLYAVLFWESEWKAWEAGHPAGTPLRLTPVIPIVFHTGSREWHTHRELIELIGGPEELQRHSPQWRPLFWDLAEWTPEELLGTAGEWLAALAVVRAERSEAETFREVFAAVLRRLEGLSEEAQVRWHDLLWFVLSWALRRRPGNERLGLWETARQSQSDARQAEEIRRMSETIEKTWEQEVFERGEAHGEQQGQLRTLRETLQLLLAERFGPLPRPLAEEIAALNDIERLRGALRQVVHVESLSDLKL
jgi:hypothetical protein